MAIVDYEYYTADFMGLSVDEADFPQFEKWAEMVIKQATFNRVNETTFPNLPVQIQEAVKNAICAQISFYSVYGIESAIIGATTGGFTVGKVSLNGGGSKSSGVQGLSCGLCLAAKAFLEQTGLLSPAVGVYPQGSVFPWV